MHGPRSNYANRNVVPNFLYHRRGINKQDAEGTGLDRIHPDDRDNAPHPGRRATVHHTRPRDQIPGTPGQRSGGRDTADEVHSLGPCSWKKISVNLPSGTTNASIGGHVIKITWTLPGGGTTDSIAVTEADVVGTLPTTNGVHYLNITRSCAEDTVTVIPL